jgi:putative effector of murein hydrolase
MYNHTNFFIENLKSLFNIYNVMALIQDYDKLCFYILTVLMSTMILALVLTLIFAPYNDYYIGTKNILSIPLLDILDRIIV